nr:hypothetical protein [Tanacetum cinerariifolium]
MYNLTDFSRPYHTQPNGVRKMLIARKRVRALPSGRLASRYPSDHSSSDHFSSDDSLPDPSSDYSLNSSSGHSLPDSSFVAPATISARPSRKRCRSDAASVPLVAPVSRAFSLVWADLLPPHKRIRGDVTAFDCDESMEGNYEAYYEPDINSDIQANIDADTAAVEAAATREANVGVEVGTGSDREDEVEVKEEAESGDRDTIETGVDMASDIKKRCLLLHVTPTAMEEMIERRVTKALEAYEANRNRRPIMKSGHEHVDNNGDDNGKSNEDGGEMPLIFKGTEGLVGMTRWFEKMETVLHINNCLHKYQKALMKLMSERERLKKQREKTKNQKEKLKSLCHHSKQNGSRIQMGKAILIQFL